MKSESNKSAIGTLMWAAVRSTASAIALLAASLTSQGVTAQSATSNYPQRIVKVTVPFSTGGSPVQIARLAAKRMSEIMGQQFVVEARPGAGGMIGINEVLKTPADGYSILFLDSSAYAIVPYLFRKAQFEPLKSLTPIAPVAVIPYLLAVNPSLNVSTVQEFVAYAKKNPGLAYGSAGNGTPHHLAMELLASTAGLDVRHIPFKGANDAVVSLVSGDISAGFLALQSALPMAKAGKIKIIGVSTLSRMRQIPDVPTIAESGYPTFEISTIDGFFARAGTPSEIIAKLHEAVIDASKSPEVQAGLDTLGLTLAKPMSPSQYGKVAENEAKLFEMLVKRAKAEVD